MQRAMGLIGISQIVGDVTKPTVYLAQLEFLRPFAINVFAGFVETLERAALELRHDFQRLIDPVQVVFFMGKHLDPSSRRRLQALTNAQIFEIGGLGDIGLWMSECQAHDGLHVREDMFFVETIDSATGESQSLENPNELVFTSLWEESMNYVRWRSDDIGVLKTEPCICGRTTGRLLVLGRVWERTAIGNSTFLPQQIEDVLSELLAEEPFFQIVRHRNGRRAELRVSLPSDFSTDDVSLALAEQLGIEIEAQSVDKETIVAGSPFYKYRQVVDVD
jgi:phenylacetate-CoA ligase